MVRVAAEAVDRLAGQDTARHNARLAATDLTRGRVERLEVEHYLEQRSRRAKSFRAGGQTRRAAGG
jgi:hypothetical protein